MYASSLLLIELLTLRLGWDFISRIYARIYSRSWWNGILHPQDYHWVIIESHIRIHREKLPHTTYGGCNMSLGSWRVVGVKLATNDLFLITMKLPSVFWLASVMLCWYRRKLPATSEHYSSTIYHSLPSSVWELGWCSGYDRRRFLASEIGRHGETHQSTRVCIGPTEAVF